MNMDSSSRKQQQQQQATPAQLALRLLDQRRIRRQAIVRDFDLAPDATNNDDNDDEDKIDNDHHQSNTTTIVAELATEKDFMNQMQQQRQSRNDNRSPTNKKDKNNNNNNSSSVADFKLFGRLIPSGVSRDRTRQYLLTEFNTLTAEVEDEYLSQQLSKKSNIKDNNETTDTKIVLPTSDLVQKKREDDEQQQKQNNTNPSSTYHHHQQFPTRKLNRRKQFEKFMEESKKHRKLFDAASGELSADLSNGGFSSAAGDGSGGTAGIIAEATAADGRFRKLVRSCDPEIVEQLQKDLVENRRKLPLPILSTTMYVKGAFPDRPPSPRTLSMQRRRIRLAEILKSTSDYQSSCLDPFAHPCTMFWQFNYLLKGAKLAPKSSFFSSSSNIVDKDSNNNTKISPLRRKSSSATAVGLSSSQQHQLSTPTNKRSQSFSSSTSPTVSQVLVTADDNSTVSHNDNSNVSSSLKRSESSVKLLVDGDNYENNNNHNKSNDEAAAPTTVISGSNLSLVISPQKLVENLQGVLPWTALSETDIDWLMKCFAPDYQEVIDRNKEAAKKSKNPSLLVALARTRRDQSGLQSLDSDLRAKLKKFEEECEIQKPPNEPVDIEFGMKRLLRALSDALLVAAEQSSSSGSPSSTKKNTSNNVHGTTSSRSIINPLQDLPSMALLCYSSLLPRALRNSRGVAGANASTPPPALTKEWLSLAESEYSVVGEEEMTSLVRRFACTWHAHFSHIANGIDVKTLVLEVQTTTSTTATSAGGPVPSPTTGPDGGGGIDNNYQHQEQQQQHQRKIIQRDPPNSFSPELQQFVGEGLEECPVCNLTSMADSNYSYVDQNILNHLRNEARGDLMEQFERRVLRNFWMQSQSSVDRPVGTLVNSKNNLTPIEEAEQQEKEKEVTTMRNNRSTATEVSSTPEKQDNSHSKEKSKSSPVAVKTSASPIISASAGAKKAEEFLLSKEWRFDMKELPDDLEDFNNEQQQQTKSMKMNTNNNNNRDPGNDDSSLLPPFSLTTINNRYFDCFVTHFDQSPVFASLMSSLMLKQIVMLSGAGGGGLSEGQK